MTMIPGHIYTYVDSYIGVRSYGNYFRYIRPNTIRIGHVIVETIDLKSRYHYSIDQSNLQKTKNDSEIDDLLALFGLKAPVKWDNEKKKLVVGV